MPIVDTGETRFREPIENGIVQNSSDGSVDELIATDIYYDPKTDTAHKKESSRYGYCR